jgi:hypothetical protein
MATAVLKPQPAAVGGATSAGHVLSLLDEEDDSLKLYALQQLDRSMHDFWFQISSSIAAIEALYEDEEFSHRELAALVASKVGWKRGRAIAGPWSLPGGLSGAGQPGGVPWGRLRDAAQRPRPPPPPRAPATDRRCRRRHLPSLPLLSLLPCCRCFTTWETWMTP